jgi:hypothetical protein
MLAVVLHGKKWVQVDGKVNTPNSFIYGNHTFVDDSKLSIHQECSRHGRAETLSVLYFGGSYTTWHLAQRESLICSANCGK